MKGLLFSLVILSSIVSVDARNFDLIKDKRVEQIKLLDSTNKDIDKIFGKREGLYDPIRVKAGTILIDYSFGRCSEYEFSEWDGPENVVIGFDFSPRKDVKMSSLKLDLSDFRLTFESDHNLPLFTYSHDGQGVKYTVDKGTDVVGGYLHSIGFYPSTKHEKLKCKRN